MSPAKVSPAAGGRSGGEGYTTGIAKPLYLLYLTHKACSSCGVSFDGPPHHQLCRQCWGYLMAYRAVSNANVQLRGVER